jgi:hypothetical protein
MIRLKRGGTLLLLVLLLAPCYLYAASEPFGIDVQELDRQKPAPAPKPEKNAPKPEKKKKSAKTRHTEESRFIHYTVKPGDHIFKILVGKLGMSNDTAEKLIPEIIRINNISNIKSLQVGSTLLIPRLHEHAEATAKKETSGKKREEREKPSKGEAVARREARREAKREKVAAAPALPAPPAAPCPVPPAPPHPPRQSQAAAVAEAPGAPVPAASAPAALPPVAPPPPVTWVCSVTEKEPAKMADTVLNALSIPYTKNKIIASAQGAATSYSIRVDRYFEYKGGRYVISIGENDPYTYTLIRLLESAGYHVLMIGEKESFPGVGEKLLKLMGIDPDFGIHQRQGGKEMMGFLVRPENAAGREVLVTSQPADKNDPWVMKPGCAVK